MTEQDPRLLIAEAPMSAAQKRILWLTAVFSALDGFEVLCITFVAPILAKEFNAGNGALGLLFSSGPVGMLIGALVLAAAADTIGRRPVALISLSIMSVGMIASALSQSLFQLTIVRLFTGIGFGAMVVVVNTVAVEFSNIKARPFALSMNSVGFSLGGMVGGATAALLMPRFGWQAVFLCGGVMSIGLLLTAFMRLPESLSFLLARPGEATLARVNRLLTRFGHAPLTALPPGTRAGNERTIYYGEIFSGEKRATTLRVVAISFLVSVGNFYFLSWNPKLMVDLGFNPSQAALLAGISALGGACGCIIFGLLAQRFGGRALALVCILVVGVLMLAFSFAPPIRAVFAVLTPLCGAFMAMATVGLYVTAADAFEPRFRATGMGLMVGMGRVGAIVAPSMAGSLFALGGTRASVTALVGIGVLLAGVILQTLRRRAPAI